LDKLATDSKLNLRYGLATQIKNLSPLERASSENRRVGRVAEQKSFLEASRWFTRERSSINELHLQICRIPAPTFFEQQRAEWLRGQFEAWGWTAKLDRAGNVIASLGGDDTPRPFVVSAHLDTVFAPGRPEDVFISRDGRFAGPGVSDNGAGLTALMVFGRMLPEISELRKLGQSVLLVANVGEEGEGNLSGMRYVCRQSAPLAAIRAFLVLDGPSTDHITAQALASRRFEVAFAGPGGHSWNDSGTPNPVHAIGAAISTFSRFLENRSGLERKARFSYNFGIVEGGTSINSIPSAARAKLDLRSEDPLVLEELTALLSSAVEASLERENRAAHGTRLTAKIKELGSRPGGRLPQESSLLATIRAVDHQLNIRSKIDCASTDANVPLSLGLPAVSIGAGGQGGGAHTREEWYQPEGRESGLRRILLILASLLDSDVPEVSTRA
jgi:acetylornithine deacetylase/succinyl-diaminopimelate desuccinylase-like protein